MQIAIASGKGGTGKTTVATSLALALSDQKVSFLDCDVEAPNAHIFLDPHLDVQNSVYLMLPSINDDICTGCGRCAEICEFHALASFGGKTTVFQELCHGCGSCMLICPEKAITEIPKQIGILEEGYTIEGIHFSRGVLNIGEPMAVPIISKLKDLSLNKMSEIIIIDSPPGASCPVVESLRGSDFILLVTEPTPFGLHDLKLAFKLTQELNIPAGVIINRDGIGNNEVEYFCKEEKVPILLRIPYQREIGEGIAEGKALVEIQPKYYSKFKSLYRNMLSILKVSMVTE